MEETLTKEQINHWRRIISFQIEENARKMGLTDGGYGIYAFIMPEEEVIAYWRKIKDMVEAPEKRVPEITLERKKFYKKKCNHSNSIKGSKGRYCLDCEMYV